MKNLNSLSSIEKNVISEVEFKEIINSVAHNSYSSCKIRLGLTLLFISGIRLSSLLDFSIKKFELLLQEKKSFVFTNKNHNSIQQIFLDNNSYNLLLSRQYDFLVLKKTNHLLTRYFQMKRI